ncbi:MAG: TetR/AcrR family transcriptional regulator [Saccharofermentans sp.]|nr:TetR/AcrR family transcriptional regulator [Saccharofermentans sp.]
MNVKDNQRARATRYRIIKAVFETIAYENKSVERVTVREICEKTGINRSTFYAHFRDVYDVVEKVERTMADGLTESFLNSLDSGEDLETCFLTLFEYVREYREFYSMYFGTFHQSGVIDVSWDLLQDKLKGLSYEQLGYRSEKEMEYHKEFFLFGMTAMIRHWVMRNCEETPQEILEFMLSYQNRQLMGG